MVVLVSKKTDAELGIANSLLTVLGTVLGLVISFRTSTAYERCVNFCLGLSAALPALPWVGLAQTRVTRIILPALGLGHGARSPLCFARAGGTVEAQEHITLRTPF